MSANYLDELLSSLIFLIVLLYMETDPPASFAVLFIQLTLKFKQIYIYISNLNKK